MEDSFVCFESEAFLFLFPLEQAGYILPAAEVKNGWIQYGNTEVRAVPFWRFWNGSGGGRGEIHVLICRLGERLCGLIADQVVGVMKVPAQNRRELPLQVRSEKNRFIAAAVYLDKLQRWAYVVDPGILMEIEVI